MTLTVGASSVPAAEHIHLNGSTTMAPVMKKIVQAYREKHPEQTFGITASGSGAGVHGFLHGTTDIAMLSRPMTMAELRQCQQMRLTPSRFIIALDGLIPIIHQNNTISNLTTEQARDIYRGRIRNWAELGGRDSAIIIYTRAKPSASYDLWYEKVLERTEPIPTSIRIASNIDMVDAIARDTNGIGYIGLGFISPLIKALQFDGVEGTEHTVRERRYPLVRTLNLYTKGAPTRAETEFLEFIQSDKGQTIIQKEGFVSIQ